jgi:hypothetical protein
VTHYKKTGTLRSPNSVVALETLFTAPKLRRYRDRKAVVGQPDNVAPVRDGSRTANVLYPTAPTTELPVTEQQLAVTSMLLARSATPTARCCQAPTNSVTRAHRAVRSRAVTGAQPCGSPERTGPHGRSKVRYAAVGVFGLSVFNNTGALGSGGFRLLFTDGDFTPTLGCMRGHE